MALFVDVQVIFSEDAPRISSLIDMREQAITASFDMDLPTMSFKVPLKSVSISSSFTTSARMFVRVNLQPTTIESEFVFDPASIRLDETEELSLNDVGFKPGDTLIIDTDTLEILLNGEPDVESWVSGGVFIQLKPGGNIITVNTSPANVALEITVLWADRYL